MKKPLSALLGTGLIASSLALVGCGEKSEVKQEEKITTPGGTTTTTKEEKIKQTGDNPPAPGTATPSAPR